MPSVRASDRIESIVSCTELMKQAEHCGAFLEAAVEPDRAVEGGLLVDQDVLQVVAERLQILVAREVACPCGPTPVIVSTTRPISCLTLRSRSGRADLTAEIFRDDDVGGLLRPGLRNLDVALLEHQLAALVADQRRREAPTRPRRTDRRPASVKKRGRPDRSPPSSAPRDRLRPRQARSRMGSTRFDRLLAGTGGSIGCASFISNSVF